MKKSVIVSACLLALPAYAQEAAPADEEAIVVIASKDPIIAFIRADALEHKGKVVPQVCTMDLDDGKKKRRVVRRYETNGPNAFSWQLNELSINGAPATEKELKQNIKAQNKRNAKRDPEDDDRYGMFADLVADDDRLEKLPPENGLLRYRINRLPEKLARDMPGAIASRLQPILWIANTDGEPYVQRLEVSLGDFRMYLVAKINTFDFDMIFERRPDGYVKERSGTFAADYSFFGSRKRTSGGFNCDIGGTAVARPGPPAAP